MSEPTFDPKSVREIHATLESEMARLTGMIMIKVPLTLAGALEDAGVAHRDSSGMLCLGGKID